ncbi:hypothetical protein [Dyella acidiphila]|uniref:Uncharacterized protein n=1 Tax=Dyella acidiphila TaxID=2775866 RepID=A0ABR9G9M3_9GAMM|nr:hypothetical protein [Dyella acidiphila]MBE1160751.1 hypothetical protein [Dyella acidiphila]
MTQWDPDISAALRRVAEVWLKRPLTAAEEQELQAFQQTAAGAPGGGQDPAAYARLQAEHALQEGQARTDTVIRDVLHKIQGTTRQALQAQDREAQAILKTVEAARTLADLRPSSLNTAAPAAAVDSQMVMAQIADRLANLVKAEVTQIFTQKFGGLQQKLEQAIGEFTAVKQQMQQAMPAGGPPPASSPAPVPTPSAPAPPSDTPPAPSPLPVATPPVPSPAPAVTPPAPAPPSGTSSG